jgi:hypothetical protein
VYVRANPTPEVAKDRTATEPTDMKTSLRHAPLLSGTILLLTAATFPLQAQLKTYTFGPIGNQFTMDFVTIGNPGNPPDTTGAPNPAGSVPYVYLMGK